MLPATVNKRVEALGTLSRQGQRINGLYRLMESPDLWLRAYAKVYANTGATTKGVDPVTMDGFSIERIENLGLFAQPLSCRAPHEGGHAEFQIMPSPVGERIGGAVFIRDASA